MSGLNVGSVRVYFRWLDFGKCTGDAEISAVNMRPHFRSAITNNNSNSSSRVEL